MFFASQCSGCPAYETDCASGNADSKGEAPTINPEKLTEGANTSAPTCGSASPTAETIMIEKSYPRT